MDNDNLIYIELTFISASFIIVQPRPESITDHNLNKDFRAHRISSLQVDSLKKGFDGFDKEGGIINQTSMVMILKSMGVDVTKVKCWLK